MIRRNTAFLVIAVLCCAAAKDTKDAQKTAPAPGETVTRLLRVDYKFDTESILYDVLNSNNSAPVTLTAGNFSFETLHYDMMGSILAKFTITDCKTGACENIAPVYVGFMQGGNNIEGVYVEKDVDANWNFLFAIINTIYTPADNGEGDSQAVKTAYGDCQVTFSRPEDKKFKRTMEKCIVEGVHGYNHSLVSGLHTSEFSQEVLYQQNTKVDADIVIIDAVEIMKIKSPFHEKWGFHMESRTHVEITNRSHFYADYICDADKSADACAREHLNLKKVGDKLYEKVQLGRETKKNKFSALIANYRNHLHEMGDAHICRLHSSLYSKILNEAREASVEQWTEAIKSAENEPLLPAFGNMLGQLGTVDTLKVAREVLFVEGPEFIDDYLFGAAQSTLNDEKWHKQLMYWLSDPDSETYWRVANSVASVLRRRCEHSKSSLNACNTDKDRVVSKFITDITSSKKNEDVLNALDALVNLPIKGSFEFAKKFLCGSYGRHIQLSALKIVNRMEENNYDAQLIAKLVKIFRNTCPEETSTSESQLATDILVKSVLVHQNVATLLLRSETLNPDNHEKWAYFYKAVQQSGIEDELKEELWHRMRKFKVFRPNYAHRSLVANSHSFFSQLHEFQSMNLLQHSSTEFDEGVLKRSELDLQMKKGKQRISLFGLSIDSAGLDGFIKEASASSAMTPYAHGRISLFNHFMPKYVFFNGTSELMSAVWAADGQSFKAFEGNIELSSVSSRIPLLSGLSLVYSLSTSATVRITGVQTISLWNRQSETILDVSLSVSQQSSASLQSASTSLQTINSHLSLLTSINSETNVEFMEIPFKFCFQIGAKPTTLRFTSENLLDGKRTNLIDKERKYQSETYRLEEKTTEQCNLYNRRHL